MLSDCPRHHPDRTARAFLGTHAATLAIIEIDLKAEIRPELGTLRPAGFRLCLKSGGPIGGQNHREYRGLGDSGPQPLAIAAKILKGGPKPAEGATSDHTNYMSIPSNAISTYGTKLTQIKAPRAPGNHSWYNIRPFERKGELR